jgi:hypothetical protein
VNEAHLPLTKLGHIPFFFILVLLLRLLQPSNNSSSFFFFFLFFPPTLFFFYFPVPDNENEITRSSAARTCRNVIHL